MTQNHKSCLIDEDCRISVYRTSGGAEVDFIIEQGKSIIAYEVKAKRRLDSDDFNGLQSFQSFFGKNCDRIILYMGPNSYEERGVQIHPWDKGIAEIVSGG